MSFVIVTGVSGAGKTRAIRCLEDMGFYCVDNMPPTLVGKFAELCYQSQGKLLRVALVIDVRSHEMFSEFENELEELTRRGYDYKIVFLDASDEIIVTRYKKTRRSHPLIKDGSLLESIKKEREMLANIKDRADFKIDTTHLDETGLKARINSLFSLNNNWQDNMLINIVSFGFKHGVPMDSDLVFDVRFLPNPYYVDTLKKKTGKSRDVSEYVMNSPVSVKFYEKLKDMLEFLIPQYIEEGKGNLVIAIGCTGGKHRSVTIANMLYDEFSSRYRCVLSHKDINKN